MYIPLGELPFGIYINGRRAASCKAAQACSKWANPDCDKALVTLATTSSFRNTVVFFKPIWIYIYIYSWLVVSTPLKNMLVSWDYYSQLNGI